MGMLAIFTYDFELSRANFEKAGIRLNTLSDYHHLLEQAVQQGAIVEGHIDLLKEWREQPDEWGK
jgi:orotate phosphoribosyltransferase